MTILTPINTSLAEAFESTRLPPDNAFHFTKDVANSLPPILAGWIKLYLMFKLEGVRADRTINRVRTELEKFQVFFEGYTSSDNITFWTPQVTKRFLDHLKDETKLKPVAVERIMTSLRLFVKWIYAKRPDFFNLGNPIDKPEFTIKKARPSQALTHKQIQQMFVAAQSLILLKKNRPKRDLAILSVLLYAGLRTEEVCYLKMWQFKGTHFEKVKRKGSVYKHVVIKKETAEAIQCYIDSERRADAECFDSDYLFLPSSVRKTSTVQGVLSVNVILRIIEKLSKTASAHLNDKDKFMASPDMLWHTYVCQISEKERLTQPIKPSLNFF